VARISGGGCCGRALAALGLGLALACASLPEPAPEAPSEPAFVDARGRRYVVRRLPKAQAIRLDEHHARTRWGIDLELAGEDAESWHFKYYLPADPVPPPPAPASAREEEVSEPGALRETDTLRFEPFGRGLPQQGQWRDGFDVADLDGDGRLDLAHGPPRKGTRAPQLWLGDGRGAWRAWGEARFPALPYDYGDARAGDLDADGALDLVLAVHLRGLLALRGDGRGGFVRFGEGLDFDEGGRPGFSTRAARLVDFDGDGALDVVALGEGPRLAPARGAARSAALLGGAQGVVLYRGLGGGRFERRDRGTGPREIFGGSLAVADFDADGRPDLATSSGQLGRRDLVRLGRSDAAWEPLALEGVRAKAYVRAVAAADFDRDGRADLAVGFATIASGSWRSGLDVLLSRPGAAWERVPLLAESGTGGPRALAAGDLDGDAAADLVALDAAGALHVLRGDGAGGFARERAPSAPFPGCRGTHLALADLDGDGLADLVASFARERADAADPVCPGEGGLAAWRTLRHAPAR
jgi:hypothetical protein